MSIKSKLRAEFLMFNSVQGIFVVIETFCVFILWMPMSWLCHMLPWGKLGTGHMEFFSIISYICA